MLKLTGQLVNIFTPSRRAEEDSDPTPKAQILGEVGLPSGEFRKELITIGIKSQKLLSDLSSQIGSDVVLASVFSRPPRALLSTSPAPIDGVSVCRCNGFRAGRAQRRSPGIVLRHI